MQVKAGTRLKSTVSSTEVIVVRPPADEIEVTCGGVAMAEVGEVSEQGTVRAGSEGQALLGKRYYDEETGLELLCTRGGQGQLACDGRVLLIKEAKPLPSSD